MQTAERMKRLPPYLFAQIDALKKDMISQGVDVVSLGIGDPDLPTPKHIINALNVAASDPKNHQYPTYSGCFEFRKAVADWYKRRFEVDLDPETEVLTLIGSKEGIAHIFLAYIEKGDYTLAVDPGYPVYKIGTLLAGGEAISIPLLKENNFLPDLDKIDPEVAHKAKIFFINFPHNPTASVCELEFFERLVDFANKYRLIICHDAAYSEICFDGYKAPSFLQAKGAKEVGIEFHSLSKTYNMTGWRIGFAVGNEEIIKNLTIVKTNIDSGVFQAVQYAGIAALSGPPDDIEKINKIYQQRRDLVIDTFNQLGWTLTKTLATFYIWLEVPVGYNSTEFALKLLKQTGVIVVPGVGYGEHGEGYFRISLTVSKERLKEAMERIKRSGIRFK